MAGAKLTADGRPAGFLRQDDSFETVLFEVVEGAIGVLTLNRPNKLNAFDEQMISEIRQVLWRVSFDPGVKILLITGAGRAFCSGRDIVGLDYENNLPSAQYRAYVRANHEMLDDIEAIEKPVIALVNGICAGGGVELAISCDFRIAAKAATFILTENNLGVLPASGACSRMIQMIGMTRLKEMVIAARSVSAEKAERWGLVNDVCESSDLMESGLSFARELLQRAPLAMGIAKHIINTCQNTDTETGRILERLGQSILIQTSDAKEGMRAFREKRRPNFKGK
jgi:enoyl-CoA hydratase/carnithine racemase